MSTNTTARDHLPKFRKKSTPLTTDCTSLNETTPHCGFIRQITQANYNLIPRNPIGGSPIARVLNFCPTATSLCSLTQTSSTMVPSQTKLQPIPTKLSVSFAGTTATIRSNAWILEFGTYSTNAAANSARR